MNDAELVGVVIGFATLGVSCVALFLDSRRKFRELETDKESIKKDREFIQKERESIQRDRQTIEELKKVTKALMEIVTSQRDEIRILQTQLAKQASISEQQLKTTQEQHAWQVIRDIAGGAAWLLDHLEDEEE